MVELGLNFFFLIYCAHFSANRKFSVYNTLCFKVCEPNTKVFLRNSLHLKQLKECEKRGPTVKMPVHLGTTRGYKTGSMKWMEVFRGKKFIK